MVKSYVVVVGGLNLIDYTVSYLGQVIVIVFLKYNEIRTVYWHHEVFEAPTSIMSY